MKNKKCRNCGKSFKQTYSTLQVCCSTGCAVSYSKSKKKESKKELDKVREDIKSQITLAKLIKSTVEMCHKYIRLRDQNKPCVSCLTNYKKDFDAGHFYPAGKFSNLKFDENNIHGQCIQCNRRNEGNIANYRVNLNKRLTSEEIHDLDLKASEYKKDSFKWDRSELNKIKREYSLKIKQWNIKH